MPTSYNDLRLFLTVCFLGPQLTPDYFIVTKQTIVEICYPRLQDHLLFLQRCQDKCTYIIAPASAPSGRDITRFASSKINQLDRAFIHHWTYAKQLKLEKWLTTLKALQDRKTTKDTHALTKTKKWDQNWWNSLKINDNLWKSVKINEDQWKSMKIYENLRKSMRIHENSLKSMKTDENL